MAQVFDSFNSEPQGVQDGRPIPAWSEMNGAPDYVRQVTISLTGQSAQGDPTAPKGAAFDPIKSQPDHELQGDKSFYDDPGRAGRGYTRETSGATGARSGSVSRDRSNEQRGRGDAIDVGADSRRVTSPSRAMGARSASIGSPTRGRRELPTTDGAPTGFRSTSSSRQVSEA